MKIKSSKSITVVLEGSKTFEIPLAFDQQKDKQDED